MTPNRLDAVRQLIEHCSGLPAGQSLRELVEHVEELQGFVRDMAAHLEREQGPMKTAEYYVMRSRVVELRERIEPKMKEGEQQ